MALTLEQQHAFQRYRDELVAWNTRANLTAIIQDKDIQVKHFLDSLSCLAAISAARLQAPDGRGLAPGSEPESSKPEIRLVDVGTGAGFPGLPLKIVCPSMRLTLIEATGKKVDFLNHIVAILELRNVTVIKARAEEVGRDLAHREQYDWAVARAVAEMPTLAEYLLPLVRRGGHALAQKGEGAPAETHAAAHAIARLGGELERLIPVELPSIVETRYLVVFKKVAATPQTYPRRPGVPAKLPLN
jgi:16S rRNA (guanine527-N7)-methyltransferase